MWLTTVGYLAAGVGTVVSVPQVVRLLRTGHADGVSLPTAVLGALFSATWLTYGLILLDPTQVLANTPGLAGALAITVIVVRRTRSTVAPIVAASVGWALIAATAYVFGGPTALGLAATGLALVRQGPQVVQAFRGGSLAALSPVSYALGMLCAGLWGVYGFGTAQPAVWLCALLGLVLSTLVLGRRIVVAPPRPTRPLRSARTPLDTAVAG